MTTNAHTMHQPKSKFFKGRIPDGSELPWLEIRALASIGAGLLLRHMGDPKAINKLAWLSVPFDGLRHNHNEAAKCMAMLIEDAAGGPYDLKEQGWQDMGQWLGTKGNLDMEISDQTIYDAAPLFFRLKTEGYFDPDDHMAPDIQAIRTELGLPAHVQERRYPPIHYWGIECPNDWFEIVLDAVTQIEVLLKAMVAAGTAVDVLPGCTQIKEKSGGLRLYWRATDTAPFTQAMRDAIAHAEDRVLALKRRQPC